MRAARTLPGPLSFSGGATRKSSVEAGGGYAPRHAEHPDSWLGLGLGALFVLGYMGGIIAAKLGGSGIGSTLAGYYLDAGQYERFTAVWSRWFAGGFLQLTAVLLCGFSAVGGLLLVFGFAAKGWVLGLCAAGAYATAAQRGLVVYWLLTCLPDLGLLWVMVWFSMRAFGVSGAIARFTFGSNGHTRLQPNTKWMLIRYFSSLAWVLFLSGVGSASAVLFAGVLL